MKEKDLYEIGNRLYDHEVDPPTDGWKKIAGVIQTPKTASKVTWFGRKLWIPLVLIVPVAFFFFAQEREARPPLNTASFAVDPPEEQPSREQTEEPVTDDKFKDNTPFKYPARRQVSGFAQTESEGPVEAQLSPNDIGGPSIAPESSDTDGVSTIIRPVAENIAQTKQAEVLASAAKHVQSADSPYLRAGEEKTQDEDADEVPVIETKEETSLGVWRINFSITPSYVARSVKPVADDEVFVTKIGNNDGTLAQRIGVGFAIGVGKAITKDLYVDAHVTFSHSKQNTFFSYSTGRVDTVLAVQQPDETIRLTPVYAEHHREMKNNYTYGGVRIATTYYFLSQPHGRYNLLVAAGVNYLLSADVQERFDGQWIDLANKNLHKFNYTFTVGAGYTLDLHEQWALMINPVLTYNIRQVKNGDLPYRLDQRPFGLNIMLSRRLGKS